MTFAFVLVFLMVSAALAAWAYMELVSAYVW